MQPSSIEPLLLKALYKAPGMSGEIVTLFREKGVSISLDRAQAIGGKLHTSGYIDYVGSRGYADATLTNLGIHYVKEHSKEK